MANTLFPPTVAPLMTRSIILVATRCWRSARDSHTPVQPALYRALTVYRCDVLSPVLDSLLALYERCIGRRLSTGASGHADISGDEHDLLDLLAGANSDDTALFQRGANSGLVGALRIALRSARIMLRLALEPGDQPVPAFRMLTIS